jgi:maltose-binding protein MalE
MPEMQEAWKRDPQGKQAFEVIKYAIPEPNVRGWQDVRTYLEEALQSVVTGTDTPQSALDKAAEKANKALASKA